MTQKLLKRSKDDRIVAGVLGGLGEYFNIDPLWIRLGVVGVGGFLLGGGRFVLTTLVIVGGYIASVFIIPEEEETTKRVSQKAKTNTRKKK